MSNPLAILVAGANGAGKTTFARQFMPTGFPSLPYFNADEIRLESIEYSSDVSAAREFLRRLEECETRTDSFALETTLSSMHYARRIPSWREAGYVVMLHFIEVQHADLAVQRVRARIAAGGHSIPEAVVRRRFVRGLELFHQTYKSLVDRWYHWHSDDGGLSLVHESH